MNDKIKEIEEQLKSSERYPFMIVPHRENVKDLLSIITSLSEERDRYRTALGEVMKVEPLPGEYIISGVIKNIIRQALKEE